ncbi:MAG: response regulator [Acidobacteriota bacterium]
MVVPTSAPSSSASPPPAANKRRNVLVIGVSPDEFGRVAPFLERDAFDVDRFPSGSGALELLSRVPFEVLIVRYPLRDMALGNFLRSVRRDDNPCMRSPLLLLTQEDRIDEAQTYVGRGANRVITLGESENRIQEVVSSLLNVAPRKAARFIANLEIKLGGTKDRLLCQTENISASGMLLKTERRYELGTKIHMEFTLPNDTRPIVGIGQVMRHSVPGRDPVSGMGMRFLSFAGDSQRRYQAFLSRLD